MNLSPTKRDLAFAEKGIAAKRVINIGNANQLFYKDVKEFIMSHPIHGKYFLDMPLICKFSYNDFMNSLITFSYKIAELENRK